MHLSEGKVCFDVLQNVLIFEYPKKNQVASQRLFVVPDTQLAWLIQLKALIVLVHWTLPQTEERDLEFDRNYSTR